MTPDQPSDRLSNGYLGVFSAGWLAATVLWCIVFVTLGVFGGVC